jgi:hypothetical protein
VGWTHSFLSQRTISLTVNDFTADVFEASQGTPQGSPFSPLLSAIFTAEILRRAEAWPDGDACFYVDDRAIYVGGATYRSAIGKAMSHLESMCLWLCDFGLRLDPDKTELMFFHPPGKWGRSLHLGKPPTHVPFRLPGGATHTIKVSQSVRYLGVFFTPTLDWHLHVTTLSNRARGTVRSLKILGNSIRGIKIQMWRTLYNAVVAPVLTYGCPVWFTDRKQKGLIDILQTAQNDATRACSGCFRTSPTHALNHMTNIPPIRFRLRHLLQSAANRLDRLPPWAAIKNLHLTDKITYIPHHHAPHPPIYRLPDNLEGVNKHP